MKYKHFIMIRFSLRFSADNWKHNIKEWDYNRLNNRFFLFENITLPSLINQNFKDNCHVIIMITDDLPQSYKNRLNFLIQHHTQYIHVETIKDRGSRTIEFLKKKYIPDDVVRVATTRLDDDDALHCDFNRLISNYILEVKDEEFIVTFPKGFWLNIDRNGQKVTYLPAYKRFIACGLTRVASPNMVNTIYCGNHNSWGKRGFKTIFNYTPGMYVVANHSFNDSFGRLYSFLRKSNNKNLDDDFHKKFPFIKEYQLLNLSVNDIGKGFEFILKNKIKRRNRKTLAKQIQIVKPIQTAKPKPKTEPKPEPKTEPKPKPKTEPKPKPKTEPKPKPKPKTEPKPKT